MKNSSPLLETRIFCCQHFQTPELHVFHVLVSGFDCHKTFKFAIHKHWTTIKHHWSARKRITTGDLCRSVDSVRLNMPL